MRSKKVIELLKLKCIEPYDIKAYLCPSRSYPNQRVRNFIDYVYKLDLDEKIKKDMINKCIGKLGKWKGKKVILKYTTSEIIAYCLRADQQIKKYEYCNGSDLIIMKKTTEYDIPKHHRNIYHDVLIDTIFNLYKLTTIALGPSNFTGQKPVLLAYKTDSITVANAFDVPLSTENGGYKMEKVCLSEKIICNELYSDTTPMFLKQKIVDKFTPILANNWESRSKQNLYYCKYNHSKVGRTKY